MCCLAALAVGLSAGRTPQVLPLGGGSNSFGLAPCTRINTVAQECAIRKKCMPPYGLHENSVQSYNMDPCTRCLTEGVRPAARPGRILACCFEIKRCLLVTIWGHTLFPYGTFLKLWTAKSAKNNKKKHRNLSSGAASSNFAKVQGYGCAGWLV